MRRAKIGQGWGVAVLWLSLVQLVVLVGACRKEMLPQQTDVQHVEDFTPTPGLAGVYVLNGGGVGSNETTLDFLDFSNGSYHHNIYAERNHEKNASLGDNGLDMAVHDGRLFISVNKSHRVVVLDAYTAKFLTRLDGINDCRYLAFDSHGNGYVTSYLTPGRNTVAEPRGEVVRFSTKEANLGEITGRVSVGYQPEHMLVVDESDQMFVTCSGMYKRPTCDDRLFELDLKEFRVAGSLKVATNLNLIWRTGTGFWVTARGNMLDQVAECHRFNLTREAGQSKFDALPPRKTGTWELDSRVAQKVLLADGYNDNMVVLSGDVDLNTLRFLNPTFLRLNIKGPRIEPLKLDETAAEIENPVSLSVAPNGDIFIGDAKNYNSSGMLYCFDKTGKRKWKVRTGIIPTRIVFLPKK